MPHFKAILAVSLLGSVAISALPGASLAQLARLTGSVLDGSTGDPIAGATILLQETLRGTATDEQGVFFLLGTRPGTYNVRISSVGYRTKIVEDVTLVSDQTFLLEATLDVETVESEAVIVVANVPVVDQDRSSSRALVSSTEIDRLPVRSLAELIAKTANSWNGHIRGGQRFETKVVVEGVDVSDVFYQTYAGNVTYGGDLSFSTDKSDRVNPAIFDIGPDAISEVTIRSGANDAQYVSSTGGTVLLNLTEGRGPVSGSFSARVSPSVSRPGPDSLDFYRERVDGITIEEAYIKTRTAVAAASAAGDAQAAKRLSKFTWDWDKYCKPGGAPGARANCSASQHPTLDFRGSIGGALTDNWKFALHLQFFEQYGYAPNQYDKTVSGQLKTTVDLTSKTTLAVVGILEDRGLWGDWNNRDYREQWRFNLESVAQNDGGSYLSSVEVTQILNDRSFIKLQAFRTYWRERYGYPDDDGDGLVEPGENGDFIDFFNLGGNEKYVDVSGSHDAMFTFGQDISFLDAGIGNDASWQRTVAEPVPYFEDTILETNGLKLDYANQLGSSHFVQIGTELKLRSIDYEEAQGLSFRTLNEVDGNGDALEPFIPDVWSRHPKEFAAYASDKITYGSLVASLGLRLEAFDRDMRRITDHFFPVRRDTILDQGYQLIRHFWRRGDEVPMDFFVNPSVGVAHPIGTTAGVYFSWGRAHQLRPYNLMYQSYGGNHSTSSFFSATDPDIDPIQSDNYEIGLQWEFRKGWGAELSMYARAVDNAYTTNLIATNRMPSRVLPTQFWYQTDFGYADSRGVEMTIRRLPLELAKDIKLGMTVAYTFSNVEASVSANADVVNFISDNGETQIPFDDAETLSRYSVDVRGGSQIHSGWDRRHRGVLRLTADVPAAVSVGALVTIESGLRYSPALVDDVRDRSLLTGPTNHQIDLRIEKRINFDRRFGFDLYVDVTNLLDTDNVVAYDSFEFGPGPIIFQQTGVPGNTLINASDGRALYGPARAVYFGTRFRF